MVRYMSYDPQTEETRFACGKGYNGGAPPVKSAWLIESAPALADAALAALAWWHSVPAHFEAKEPGWVSQCRAATAHTYRETY